ncbi:hypothetical protein HAX54_010001 [Datura stramonium]|uniref:Uncharacterized protein n=1 Tax=Datura stramonium TaxID=4076 RepID=A0ABS8THD5_DATST|nr:hypothetical protein [Datura stramonium]
MANSTMMKAPHAWQYAQAAGIEVENPIFARLVSLASPPLLHPVCRVARLVMRGECAATVPHRAGKRAASGANMLE